MLEAHEIAIPGGKTTIYGPLSPSRHRAAVCRIRHGYYFHDPVCFSTTFLDAACRLGPDYGATFNFLVDRRLVLAVAAQLFAVRNAFLHDPSSPLVETDEIDGLTAQIYRLSRGWRRIGIFFDAEPIIDGLEVFGIEALDDFCSGFLPYFAEVA